MAEVNTWVTAVFLGQFIMHQIIFIAIAARLRFDGWSLMAGFGFACFEYILFRNFWLGIAAQLVGA